MKNLLLLPLLALTLFAQAPAKPEPPPAGLPKGSTNTPEPGVWRWVDPQGKAWLYKRTPFGFSRVEEPKLSTGEKATTDDEALRLTTVKEEGDTLRFQRPGPFGVYTWTRRKTELNKDETIVWERAKSAKSAPAANKD